MTGQSDLARTASVVDVHWRGGPIRRMSTCEVSATLTISVAGTPGLTTTSMSHQECASGGIAANNWPRISDGDGHGADPDTGYLWHGLPSPFTALTGCFGEGEGGPGNQPAHPHGLALARLLLAAGADANDAQTLYNRMFRPDDSHLRLLFEFGLGTGDGGPWKRRLGPAAMGPAEMLAGQLAWAVLHGMDARVELLAAHGVDLDTRLDDFGGAGETAYEAAVVSGHADTAELLLRLGASPGTLGDDQRLVAAVLAADRAAAERLVAGDPGLLARAREERRGLVAWAASHAGLDAVRLAIELGWDVNRRARTDVPLDQEWETGLHHARPTATSRWCGCCSSSARTRP